MEFITLLVTYLIAILNVDVKTKVILVIAIVGLVTLGIISAYTIVKNPYN